jgi:hypothetical protein
MMTKKNILSLITTNKSKDTNNHLFTIWTGTLNEPRYYSPFMPALKPEYRHRQLKHAAESSCLSHEDDERKGGPKKKPLKMTKRGCWSVLFTLPWTKHRCDGGGSHGATVAVVDSAASTTTTTTKTAPSTARGEEAGGGGGARSFRDHGSRKENKRVRINEANLPTAITLSPSKPNKDKDKKKKGRRLYLHHEESESSTSSGSCHETRLLRGAFVDDLLDVDIQSCRLDSEGEPMNGEDNEHNSNNNNNNQWFGEVRTIPLGDLDDALLDIDLWSQAYVQLVTEEEPLSTSTSPSTAHRGGKVDLLRHSRSDCSTSSNLSVATMPGRLRHFLTHKSPVKRRRSVEEEEEKTKKNEDGLV